MHGPFASKEPLSFKNSTDKDITELKHFMNR